MPVIIKHRSFSIQAALANYHPILASAMASCPTDLPARLHRRRSGPLWLAPDLYRRLVSKGFAKTQQEPAEQFAVAQDTEQTIQVAHTS